MHEFNCIKPKLSQAIVVDISRRFNFTMSASSVSGQGQKGNVLAMPDLNITFSQDDDDEQEMKEEQKMLGMKECI